MHITKHLLMGTAMAVSVCFGTAPQANAMDLTKKQQEIIPIAAFTASGDMAELETAITEGLDAGLTINEIKEIMIQMYAYAGFPRSLNGLFALMAVVDERKAKGITDEVGKDASPIPANQDANAYGTKIRNKLAGRDKEPPPAVWQKFAPTIDVYLKEHLFGDIFARDVLDHQSRELATIGALANMKGTTGQLRFHLGAAMHTGLTATQMHDFIMVLKTEIGESEATAADAILSDVMKTRNQ